MVMTRKSRKLNLKAPLQIYLLVAASSVALTALVVLLATRTVHADAGLRPATAAPGVTLAARATPSTLSPPKTHFSVKERLHGLASWYGGVFNGHVTASGEKFDENAMTACHPTLPFGSLVRVINLVNNRSVVVRINDRGDLVNENRIVDLSYGAAQKLGMIQSGLAPVEVDVLSTGAGRK